MFSGCAGDDLENWQPKCDTAKLLKMFNELNGIYQERLMAIGDSCEANQLKVKTFEDWICDLTKQNIVLIQTVEALEKEVLCCYGIDPGVSRIASNNELQKALQKLKQSDNEIDRLKTILAENDAKLLKCKEDFITSEKSTREMRAALTAEVAEKHDQVLALRHKVQHLEDKLKQADMQTRFKDDIINELRKEIKISNNKLRFLGLDLKPYKPAHIPYVNNMENPGGGKDPSYPIHKHAVKDSLNCNKPAACGNKNISRGTSPHRSVQVKQNPVVDIYNLVLDPDIENSSLSNKNKSGSLQMTFSSNEKHKVVNQRKKLIKRNTADIPEKSSCIVIENSCGDYLPN